MTSKVDLMLRLCFQGDEGLSVDLNVVPTPAIWREVLLNFEVGHLSQHQSLTPISQRRGAFYPLTI